MNSFVFRRLHDSLLLHPGPKHLKLPVRLALASVASSLGRVKR